MGKQSFVFYDNWSLFFSNLSVEESGKLIQAICNYRLYGESKIELSMSINAFYEMAKETLNQDAIKYNELCEKNRENVKKRYDGTRANTSEYESIHKDKEKDKEKDKDKDKEKDKDFLRIEEKKNLNNSDIEEKLNNVLADKNIFINIPKKRINEKLFEDVYFELYPGDTKRDLLLCEVEAQKRKYLLEVI